MYTPMNDRENVMIPMMIAGISIDSSKKDKLKPTARASMLVAMDSIISTFRLEELAIFLEPEVSDSYIILVPTRAKSPNAIQWSTSEIRFIMLSPASQPIVGITA